MKAKLFKNNKGDYYLIDPTKGTDANDEGFLLGSSRETNFQKLSKQNCDEIFGVVDVEKLAKEDADLRFPNQGDEESWLARNSGVVWGFNKAMELNKDKVFTEQDIINYMNRVWEWCEGKKDVECSSATELRSKHIQSLQQPTEIEVEIEMQCLDPTCDGINRKGICIPGDKPKLDSEGCLILKRVV
jgi:hypothetical protein